MSRSHQKPPRSKSEALDVERWAKDLLTTTALLVGAPRTLEEDLEILRSAAAEARLALAVRLERGQDSLDRAVLNQAQVLLARLHEAALELDLGLTLGAHDDLGNQALRRAETAVHRDGRALMRGLSHLVSAAHPASPETV